MNRNKSISNRLLLGALFVGLNLLCFMGITHGRHVVHHTRVNYSHIPAHGSGRAGSRNGQFAQIVSIDSPTDHVSHVVTQIKSVKESKAVVPPQMQAALPSAACMLERPTESTDLLVRENVVALGSPPRAPGLGRAPPIA